MRISTGKYRRIAAHAILTPQGLLRSGVITLDREGCILDVGRIESVDASSGTEFYSGILIPGMVNAHCHLELSYMKGAITAGGGYMGFVAGMRDKRGGVSRREMEEAASYRDARMFADGVSVTGDISNGDSAFGVKKRSKIYYHTFAEAFGLGAAAQDPALKLCRQAREYGLPATVTPHSTYSLNEESFAAAVGDDCNRPLSIHFMESEEEAALFRNAGGFRRWYGQAGMKTDFTDRYASPAERIVGSIPPSRRILLIHNTFIGKEEIELLAGYFGDNLTFVLCPRSNMYITGAPPPARLLMDSGCRVAVGTDSLASNDDLSMAREIKTLKDIPLERLLEWITLAGAQALGVDDRYGSFEAGKRPGVVLLEGVEWESMTLKPDAATRRIV